MLLSRKKGIFQSKLRQKINKCNSTTEFGLFREKTKVNGICGKRQIRQLRQEIEISRPKMQPYIKDVTESVKTGSELVATGLVLAKPLLMVL